MGNNYHTPWTTSTIFKTTSMNPVPASLDQAITKLKNIIVHHDGGDLTYDKATGILTWSDVLRFHFISDAGLSVQNTIAAGNITLADNEFAYIDLSDTDAAVLTVSKAAITTGVASNFKAYNRLVLGYRNTTSDEFFPVALKKVFTAGGTGSGDVVGPAGAVDLNIVEFDGTTGKLIKDSLLTHANVADAISLKHAEIHAPTHEDGGSDEVHVEGVYVDVKEENTSAISKGQVCAVTGSSGTNIQVGLGNCTDLAKIRIIGLATDDIIQNAIGQTIYKGILKLVDTRATNLAVNPNAETWLAGDLLWMADTAGGMTKVRPTSGRCVKCARTVKGSSATDTLIIISHENAVWATCASGEDVILRCGDSVGVNKVSIRDYADTEVAKIDSTGNLTLIGRITPRVTSIASSATPTPNADTDDVFLITALAEAATFAAPTGTPVSSQKLIIRIKDNATARALAWNAIYRAGTDVALPTTTVISKTMYIGFIYNLTDIKWDLVALIQGF